MKGQFDITILNNHKKYNFLAVELKSPAGLGSLSSQQRNMADIYKLNNGQVLISNNYHEIILTIHEYFKDVRIKCPYCLRKFISSQSLRNHIKVTIKCKVNMIDINNIISKLIVQLIPLESFAC